ncbi:hypothetical protein B0O99DRAFT_613474 [Bisporella sp. PMI_857]|nr:hypothetical protein B0O99DRAFT_613474 [Bisporella sp. PMI_857]
MASTISSIVLVLQAAFSGYNLYLASISITNLQGYEEKSKKAAEYSQTAANQLHKTRTTQTSGTLAILSSFLSSIAIIVGVGSTGKQLALAALNVAALVAARWHVGDFWRGKAKIPLPGVGDYNEAISTTQETRLNMPFLMGGWGVIALLSLI